MQNRQLKLGQSLAIIGFSFCREKEAEEEEEEEEGGWCLAIGVWSRGGAGGVF